ncbi:MAG: hypothetical protein ABIR91_02840 [Candidatus Saccharimonadales bacterium]
MRTVGEVANYTIEYGWTIELAQQVVDASRQSAIMQYTPNDAAKRFRDVNAANSWHGSDKSPRVYNLRDRTNNELAGLAWFSWRQHDMLESEHNATFAIRLYDSARGKHLSYPFAASIHSDFQLYQADELAGLWLETGTDNVAAQQLYHKLGYVAASRDESRILMTKSTH